MIPKRLTIETIYGCNASCVICPIDIPAPRRKGLMPVATSVRVLDALAPWSAQIEKVDFFGLGEPLLDPHLFGRIRHAKARGFRNIAISTNCELLTPAKLDELLQSGIDTVICSIDGVSATTHENIHRGTHFAKLVENCERAIRRRDSGAFGTRFIVRMVRSERNRTEWPAFCDFWSSRLSAAKNDLIMAHDVHNWSGEMASTSSIAAHPDRSACAKPFESLVVLRDGTVTLCTEDWHRVIHNFGNVNMSDPLDIFNSPAFDAVRRLHAQGIKNSISICAKCTVHIAVRTRETCIPAAA